MQIDGEFTALVRIKKRIGRVEFQQSSLIWTPLDSPSSSVDQKNQIIVPWEHIQDQQVSSFTSPKAMIRLRLQSNATLVMEFISDKSLQEAFDIREKAKAWIIEAQQSANHTQQSQTLERQELRLCNSSEIKQRAALLASNPTLKRQHMEMVTEGLISEVDFWEARQYLLANELIKRQKTGKTSALLTDLNGESDAAGNVVKYNLNAEVIHQIFVQYPAVRLAYQDQVPDKLSETEFWGSFFKSRYFHRDRNKAGHEDLFTKYEEKSQEKIIPFFQRCKNVDPLVDLVMTAEDAPVRYPETDPGPLKSGSNGSSGTSSIARLNRHGAYVLDPSQLSNIPVQTESNTQSTVKASQIKRNMQEAVLLDDLQSKEVPAYHALKLDKESRYFTQASKTQNETEGISSNSEEMDCFNEFKRACKSNFSLERAFASPSSALNIVNEVISRSGSEASGSETQQISSSLVKGAIAADMIPNEFKKQVYAQFHDVSELLRHFLAFKAKVSSTSDRVAKLKLDKIIEKMGEKYDELVKIREGLSPHERNLLAPLLKPFDDQLNLAFI